MGKTLEIAIGALNGAIGDYLARSGNGLATEMALMKNGRPIALTRDAIAAAYPEATGRIVLLVHGVMCTEDVWALPDGTDYGTLLARDFDFTPLYVRYNSGLAIAENGATLAKILDALIDVYPVPIDQILPVCFSMGGLVVRSACHVAGVSAMPWLDRVKRAIYVGTPHLGAPLERVGRVLAKVLSAVPDPYTRLIADIANLRSDGVKDLGDADVRHEDRAHLQGRVTLRSPRHPVPLLPSIQHYLVAGSLSIDPRLSSLFGDSLVPLPSATDGHVRDKASIALPPSHVHILEGVPHLTLAHHPAVYAQIRAWCEAP